MSASTFSLKIIIASNACGLVVDAEEVVVEKKCSTSRNIKEDLVHMSLENRLAGPIIFAREENNELEKKKKNQRETITSRAPLPCAVVLLLCALL